MADRLIEKIRCSAMERPDMPAVSAFLSKQDTVTYGELYCRACLLAQRLAAYSNTDFVFLIAARTPDLVTAIVAGLMASLPVAIIDHRLGPLRIRNVLNQARQAVGMVDGLGLRTIETVLADRDLIASIQLEQLEAFKHAGTEESVLANIPPPVTSAADSPAVVLFTSGSTGSPKGVCISRVDLDNRLAAEQEWFGLTNSDNILGVLPLSFDVGLTQLLGTLWSGGHHVLSNSWLPVDVVNKLDQFDIHGLAMSPMVWKSLVDSAEKLQLWDRLNRLRYVTLSGGTLAMHHLLELSIRLRDGVLIKTYGQTEMFRIASLKVSDTEKAKLGSVGKTYIGVDLRIVDENGNDCAPNTEGEIVACGLGAMIGYFTATNDVRDAVGKPKISWIKTGDYGYLDDDGYLFVRGRKDEMMKILDQRIFPSDVANMVAEVLKAKHIEVVPVEDRLAVFYLHGEVEKSHTDTLTLLRKQLPSHLVPKYCMALTEFPTTPSGKVDKIALKQMIAE